MSEPIPESIPTSQDPRSKRPTKRRALTPTSAQAVHVDALFAHPEREVIIPLSATKEAKPKSSAAPPEIVANVQGSSAGAGSGEFHVYKASRRREYERLRIMEEEVKREKEKGEFESRREELRKQDEAKTNKNKAKREKQKARKMKAKGLAAGGQPDGESKKDSGSGMTGTLNTEMVDADETDQGTALNEEQMDVKSREEVGIIIHEDD
ncbi:hypothetical protein GP486_000539 [Trichoglossum hirsutum]|uniref:DUF1168-domain-containing protein n=1 Tax=Trichoglossum hirsutum TaxID=265104 RepID=A0A9P8LIU4_9PEZI|nr:hypothetical protein GP486_000539 [Trichoglossum hirsutum]